MSARRIEAVYRSDHERLWRALFTAYGSRDIADEAESEAFTQALRRGRALRDPQAWIWRSSFRIAAGLASSKPQPAPVEPMIELSSRDDQAVETLDLIKTLPAQQRSVVALRYIGQLDIAAIADALETTPGTVRVQLHRAHGTLRTILEANDDR